jgi:hypothetical protein
MILLLIILPAEEGNDVEEVYVVLVVVPVPVLKLVLVVGVVFAVEL